MFIGNVSASCFKVSDVHSLKLIEYTSDNGKYQYNTKYKVESVSDSYCKTSSGGNTNNSNSKVSCGKIGKFNRKIPEITSWIINIAQVLVPVILVIMGSIDFVKALSSQKEDEIKKGQQFFIKRLIVAIIIFFVVVIVKLIVSLASNGKTESKNIIKCIDCFISNDCS